MKEGWGLVPRLFFYSIFMARIRTPVILDLPDRSIDVMWLRDTRARRLKISIHRDNTVRVSSPWRSSEGTVMRFLDTHSVWILGVLERQDQQGVVLVNRPNAEDYLRYKDAALVLIQRIIDEVCGAHDFSYGRLTIRKQATRWGSCSVSGNLNFNYRIVLLPYPLAEYIVVHELCHLRELNHSEKFWNHVGTIIPDYTIRIRELRSLH